MPFQKACSLSDLAPGKPLLFSRGGEKVLLSSVEGTLAALSASCLHRGGDLSQGEVQDGVITCPLHFWRFDLKTGVCLQVPSAKLKSYPIKVEQDDVYVEI